MGARAEPGAERVPPMRRASPRRGLDGAPRGADHGLPRLRARSSAPPARRRRPALTRPARPLMSPPRRQGPRLARPRRQGARPDPQGPAGGQAEEAHGPRPEAAAVQQPLRERRCVAAAGGGEGRGGPAAAGAAPAARSPLRWMRCGRLAGCLAARREAAPLENLPLTHPPSSSAQWLASAARSAAPTPTPRSRRGACPVKQELDTRCSHVEQRGGAAAAKGGYSAPMPADGHLSRPGEDL